jgi:hemerythrin superfamily protein
MDAILLLRVQHDESEELFDSLERAVEPDERQQLFEDLADLLAIHCTVEERYFYPALRAGETESLVGESLEDHRALKRAIAELLVTPAHDDAFMRLCAVLHTLFHNHRKAEEGELFPRAKQVLDKRAREAIGSRMLELSRELAGTAARLRIPEELAGDAAVFLS